MALGDRTEIGTPFMNRRDTLDPDLAWTGAEDPSRGVTSSRLAYDHLTRPQSFHVRVRP